MKKTIAAILVTILASAGYIVLDKASVEKIDTLASQVSSQQAVIDKYDPQADPLEMWTGCTLRCYPAEGETVQAYVLDYSRMSTSATTTTTTTKAADKPDLPEPTGTTVPVQYYTESYSEPYSEQYYQTTPTITEPTTPTITVPTTPTRYYEPQSDTYHDYIYHLRALVRITRLECRMVGKTLTGVPKYYVRFAGQVDPSYADRWVTALFGDDQFEPKYESAVILSDGSFSMAFETVLANPAVIPLREIHID